MSPTAINYEGADGTTNGEADPICQIVTPVGMMGYGFSEEETDAALQHFSHYSTPTALILDSGSTDSGPSKLAVGTTTCPRASYVRDFRKLLRLSAKHNVPILISSAGGDGSDEHVELFLAIIRELCDEPDHAAWNLKTLAIYSGVPKPVVLSQLKAGNITGCGSSVPDLTREAVIETPRIVAQMGPEPLLDAILTHPDFNVLIAGRSYDLAPFVAFAASVYMKREGLTNYTDISPEMMGAISHMGKILECGGLCATPKGMGAKGVVNSDASFDIKPLDPSSRCTPLSVAAHTLYEKTRPDILHGPGGHIDLSRSTFTQLEDDQSVRVRGSTFCLSRSEGLPYTIKLEGARVQGFRTLTMGSFRDPILIPQVHSFLSKVKEFVSKQHLDVQESWDLGFHVYGLDETRLDLVPNEVFIVVEAIAETQEVATSLASTARVHCVHGSYPNQKATSGNFAMGIGGIFEIETKSCAEFSIYHLMPVGDGEEGARPISPTQHDVGDQKGLFRWHQLTIGVGPRATSSTSEDSRTCKVGKTHPWLKEKATAPLDHGRIPALDKRPRTLLDIAKIIRSKNAGPYEVTLDVMFDDMGTYTAVKESGMLNGDVIASLYNLSPDKVVWSGFFDVAMAFKATIPRMRRGKPSCSGGYLEDDVHGSQQYIPLVNLPLPDALASLFVE